jgi:hypothetical protein
MDRSRRGARVHDSRERNRRHSVAWAARPCAVLRRATRNNREAAKDAKTDAKEYRKGLPQMNTDEQDGNGVPVTWASRPCLMRWGLRKVLLPNAWIIPTHFARAGLPFHVGPAPAIPICVYLCPSVASSLLRVLRGFAVIRTAVFHPRRKGRCARAFFDRSTDRTSRSTATMGGPPMPRLERCASLGLRFR